MLWVIVFMLISIWGFMVVFHELNIVKIPFFETLKDWTKEKNIPLNSLIIGLFVVIVFLFFLTT